ncbi:tRNA (N(6)-L-threonylcarbamoyladenosine(37)-C(2))-methylthiotransferase MtaB [Emcibacter nanhaiensis]|uniref:tRNA (N(6)-L-threonylcarbamoyladenosine(37)-C(2))-methylthiotransferase MtaB n=1 Tax=Emcibacter nanhaiensis TaxID=1505037 RepID=A0A501PMR0_9PROT|nr:tRNA (N(6)-L-threonylcarbamoyladenosine(37)-C(2))-methylthiotransferase MtaB [Emcibacter nanhaiensis]TPD61585.1 tRNA (N(6)-L-threonylcarbamoyladenosine(37)-C(2))-methylthiotransferase MtaB [Emcibacter nanhaiensis]
MADTSSRTPQIVTFGCRLNTYESEVMKSHAESAGLENTFIFNTCAVTAEATRQARQAIRRTRRENPDANIVVTGCAAQVNPAEFADMAEVNRVIGNQEKLQAKSWQAMDFGTGNSEKVLVNDIMAVKETAPQLIDGFEERTRAFVQVQNGCDHRCTFCIIPYGRGNSRSVPAGEVIAQVKRLVENGYQEVIITGVDITSYGPDLPGKPTLGKLCQQILKHVPDLKRLRLSSIDSIETDEALFQVITEEERMMPHLHLSLQAGDNMILKRMKRRHSREDSIEFCQRVRAARPDVIFGADIIAGFPTETEEMFENSLRLVNDCDLTFLHVFPYSEREGTPAAKMPQLPKSVRKERAERLRALGQEKLDAFLSGQVGQEVEILVEKSLDGGASVIGHTAHFAPARLLGDLPSGTLAKARVTGYQDGVLICEPI